MENKNSSLFLVLGVVVLAAVGIGAYMFFSGEQAPSGPAPAPPISNDGQFGIGGPPSPEGWMYQMQKPTSRETAMQQLNEHPEWGPKILELLQNQLSVDQSEEVRRGYEILGILAQSTNDKLNPTKTKAVELLREGLEDAEGAPRVQIILGLAQVEPSAFQDPASRQEMVAELRNDLKSANDEVQLAAAVGLLRLAQPGDGGPFDPAMLEAKDFAGHWERFVFHQIIEYDDEAIVKPLSKGLTHDNPAVRKLTAEAVERLAPSVLAVGDLVPQLKPVFLDPEDEAGKSAATALGNLAVREPGAAALGVVGIQSPEAKLRSRAARLFQIMHLLARVQPISAEVRAELEKPASVKALAEALGDDNAEVRQQSVATLELVGTKAQSAIPQLLDALEADSVEVQRSAASALGAVSAESEKVVPALMKQLGNENPVLRQSVANSLAKFAERAQPTLVKALESETPTVREGAAVALGRIGPDAKEALPALAAMLEDENVAVKLASALALYRIEGKTETVMPIVLEAMDSEDTLARLNAVEALHQIGPDAGAAVPALAKALSDSEVSIRRHAAQTLIELGPRAVEAVPALVALLERHPSTERGQPVLIDSDDYLSQLAVEALRAIGPSATQAKDVLEKVLVAGPDLVAADALTWIDPTNRNAVPPLIRSLTLGYQNEQDRAARALARLGQHAKDAIPALVQRLANDPRENSPVKSALVAIGEPAVSAVVEASKNPATQIAALDVLGRMGPQAASAIPTLEAFLNDPQVSALAVATLGQMAKNGEKKAVEVLIATLDNPLLRVSAIDALSEAGALATPAVKPLLSRLEKATGEEKQVLLLALGELGPVAKDAVPALEKLLEDKDEQTRISAALALYKVTGDTAKSAEVLTPIAKESKMSLARSTATLALGVLAEKDTKLVAVLEKLLSDDDPNVRLEALSAMRQLDGSINDPTPILEGLESEDDRIKMASCMVLEKTKPDATKAVSLLTPLLTHPNERVRFAAVTALGQLGKSAKSAVPAIESAFPDTGSTISGSTSVPPTVILALYRIEGTSLESVRALLSYLSPSSPSSQTHQAIFALGEVGTDANLAVPRLCLYVDTTDNPLSKAALATIEKIGANSDAVLAYLRWGSE